jgi:hypothetical protein
MPPEMVFAPLNANNPFPPFTNAPIPPTVPEKSTLTPDAIVTVEEAGIVPRPENVSFP